MDVAGWCRLLSIINILLKETFAASCAYQGCWCGLTQVFCSELHLLAMPQKLAPNNTYFTAVDFDRNNFTAITSGSLLANLTSLTFNETPITTIDEDAFDESANTMTSLTFMYARFIKLPAAFGRLNALSFLSITQSSIGDWNVDAVKAIGKSIYTLSLEQVPLIEWPSWLQYFTNLTDLGMDSCQLSSIPDNGLDAQINQLTDLSLNENNLTTIPKAISKLIAVKFLELNKNKIADVTWLPLSAKLNGLALNDNKIRDASQFSDKLKVYAAFMSEFTIKSNELTAFPNLDFLVHVTSLDFAHNKIVDPNSGSLPVGLTDLKMKSNALPRIPRILSSLHQITEVYLGSNAITALEGTAFPPFTRGVELENNLITEITDSSFPFNSSITYILLNNNPLVSISENAFLNLPVLVELNLEYTKITRMPMALLSLGKLDDLDFTNIDSLVCTCQEKGLQGWVKKQGQDTVRGTCGEVGIYYFFTVLSPDCP